MNCPAVRISALCIDWSDGQGQVVWDARDESQKEIPSGVYFICGGRPEARVIARAVFMK